MLTPTTMSTATPDFRKTYFPHPELERVHGQPTIDNIIRLHQQLKQNAASVPCNLGGGQHGFLPLVITNTQWNAIPTVTPLRTTKRSGTIQPTSRTPPNKCGGCSSKGTLGTASHGLHQLSTFGSYAP